MGFRWCFTQGFGMCADIPVCNNVIEKGKPEREKLNGNFFAFKSNRGSCARQSSNFHRIPTQEFFKLLESMSCLEISNDSKKKMKKKKKNIWVLISYAYDM